MRLLHKELRADGVMAADVAAVIEHHDRSVGPILELTTLEKVMGSPSLL
jgi:hypothetical protein